MSAARQPGARACLGFALALAGCSSGGARSDGAAHAGADAAAPADRGSGLVLARPAVAAEVNGARAELLKAAAPCYAERAPRPIAPGAKDESLETLSFSYRLVVAQKRASAADVKVERSSVADPALQSCIVKRIQGTSWSTDGNDAIHVVRSILRLGDLVGCPAACPPLRRPVAGAPPAASH